MIHELRLSKDARKDIKSALSWTLEQFGEIKYHDYRALVEEALEEIAFDPFGARIRHRPDIHKDARTLHIGRAGRKARHLFLFRIAAEGIVEIDRLLYDGMDLMRKS